MMPAGSRRHPHRTRGKIINLKGFRYISGVVLVTGYYEIELQVLSFFVDDIKVRIKADLPLDELVRIAESLR